MHIADGSFIRARRTWWRGRAWWLLVPLLVGGLWLFSRSIGQGPTLWPYSQADIGWQRLAAAAETPSPSPRELPSDAEMIAHFQAHRKEFEELLRLYRTDKRAVRREQGGRLVPFETDEYKALLQRAGITHLSEDGALWLPDPYSLETGRKARTMNLFKEYAYHGLMLRFSDRRFVPKVGRIVWKDYFHVPVVPMVEKGRLWWPRYFDSGDLHRSAPVLESLEDYPQEWLLDPPGGTPCVLRQVEAQWFLMLCRTWY